MYRSYANYSRVFVNQKKLSKGTTNWIFIVYFVVSLMAARDLNETMWSKATISADDRLISYHCQNFCRSYPNFRLLTVLCLTQTSEKTEIHSYTTRQSDTKAYTNTSINRWRHKCIESKEKKKKRKKIIPFWSSN